MFLISKSGAVNFKTKYFALIFVLSIVFNKSFVNAQCTITTKTLGAFATYSGVLGTNIVTVTVSPPTATGCVVYGLCTGSNANGFRMAPKCGGAYSTAYMWTYFSNDPTKKIYQFRTASATLCPNRPIYKPTLTLTIPSTSSYIWSYDQNTGLIYVALTQSNTLVFTISETDSTSTTQINNYFNNCSDTTMHVCSDLNWYFYNNPGNSLTLPQITQTGTILTSFHPQAISHQWYFNNVPIPGATSATLIITQLGYYHDEVTLPSGCSVSSPLSQVYVLGVEGNVNTSEIIISPNPVTDKLNLKTTGLTNRDVRISIVNANGQLVYHKSHVEFGSNNQQQIDLTTLASGVYFLKMETPTNIIIKKIIKNEP